MTALGKTLLLINIVLSLTMAALALGIYTNHIDWPGQQTPDKSASPYLEARAAVDEAGKAAAVAVGRYDDGHTVVAALEARIPEDAALYAQKLDILRGQDATGKPVQGRIQVLTFPAGVRRLDKDGIPLLTWRQPAEPLKSVRTLNAEIEATEKKIQDELRTHQDLVRKQQAHTIELNGDSPTARGLRALLAEEQNARRDAAAELQHLQSFRYNAEVETELLRKRHAALSARLKELRRLGLAAPRR